MSSNDATVDHPITKHCPILSAGEITPKALIDLEDAHNEYFIAKEISEADKVKKILGGFKCVHIRNWIASERENLLELKYSDFMIELRANYLPPNWEETVRSQILGLRMEKTDKFWDWCQNVRAMNIVLRGTDSHLNDTALRNQLEASLEPSLRNYCFREKLNKVLVLRDWVLAVKEADEKLKDDRKRSREVFEEANLNPKRNAFSSFPRTANTSGSVSNAAGGSTSKKCPRLDDNERVFLAANDGCFKCRRFNQTQKSSTCPYGFPAAVGYKKVTASRDAAGNAPKKATSSVPARGKSVNVVLPDEALAPISSDEEDAVGAIMPSAVLGNGSFSEGDVSLMFREKHLTQKFKIAAQNLDFPLIFKALLDNGAHVVLIHPDTVEKLKLERFKLKKPENVSVAISDGKKETMTLFDFVKFSISSLDNAWTSRTVFGIVAPGLCVPLILGLPFLTKNSIVIDHAARTAIDKNSGYDLLNPTVIKPPRSPPLKLREQIKLTKEHKKNVLTDLVAVCKERIRKGILHFKEVQEVNCLGAVRQAIERLSAEERLVRLGKKVKTDFPDIFKPIPHVDMLPSDYVARIKLKDAEKQITNRTYSCPRKFKEAFQTLIKQHLDAGRIQLSSSAHASPCFIIPKADPTVLPRWVNDYRQLNANTVVDNHPIPRIDDILNDCAKGKIWSTIDMTNSFFQTRMHPDDVPLTAVNTPFGLYEWLVMPMGLRNAPAIHQRLVTSALRGLIGKICHIYLDDIIIWSSTLREHEEHVRQVFSALRAAKLYINEEKTKLFQTEITFLGHRISSRGIEADNRKVTAILDWPRPCNSTQV